MKKTKQENFQRRHRDIFPANIFRSDKKSTKFQTSPKKEIFNFFPIKMWTTNRRFLY